ncbi:hypothetical protein BHE74_00020329 [Ensete ventricosum]|nr:hypothetical protein BHE74_00020329 [Ensete ventricosum]
MWSVVNISLLSLSLPLCTCHYSPLLLLLSLFSTAVVAVVALRCCRCSSLPSLLSLLSAATATIAVAALNKQLSLLVSRLTSSILLTIYR